MSPGHLLNLRKSSVCSSPNFGLSLYPYAGILHCQSRFSEMLVPGAKLSPCRRVSRPAVALAWDRIEDLQAGIVQAKGLRAADRARLSDLCTEVGVTGT